MIKIEFGKSSSKNYAQALKFLKQFDNYQLIDSGFPINSTEIDDEELIKKFRTIEKLHSIIAGWTTSKVIINNDEDIQYWRFFNQIREIIGCIDAHKRSKNKDNYCKLDSTRDGWGCKYIKETLRHLGDNSYYSYEESYWYKFGFFKNENVWEIDKSQIKERLNKEINEKGINLCPNYEKDKTEQAIDELPDFIDFPSEHWKIIYKEDFAGNVIQKMPFSIEHISKEPKRSSMFSIFGNGGENDDEYQENNNTSNISRNIPEVSFKDIGGIDEIIDIIREVIELPLIKPEVFRHLSIKPHKGILLFGEPGNGKTMIAKAIANEIKAHFIPISGPELFSKWHGESEERLRAKFVEARNHQPSIIFFDEIDSVAQKRTDSESGRLDSKFVNQLLTLMDGMETYGNVTVLASTNRPELLDDALLRPGRFDYKIEIKKPTAIGCKKIIEILTKEMPLDENVSITNLSNAFLGLSGAEISFVINEAAYNCMRRSLDLRKLIESNSTIEVKLDNLSVNNIDFDEALKKVKN